MTFDCVLFDCSGSMNASADGRFSNTRMQKALDMLFDMHKDGKIDGRTLIVPFDSGVRGGITMDLLMKMSLDEVMKLFEPAGGTNIADAFKYCGSSNVLLMTDDPHAGHFVGKCCPIIYLGVNKPESLYR